MSKQSNFVTVVRQADKVWERLSALASELSLRPGMTVSQSIRAAFMELLLRFSTVRTDFVTRVVASAKSRRDLGKLHAEFTIIGTRYAQLHASIGDFMSGISMPVP